MPIEADVKQNLIKAIKGRAEPEKLRLVGLYKQLMEMYEEDDRYGQIVNQNTYASHEKVRALADKGLSIARGSTPVVAEDLVDANEFFTAEEQASEEFKAEGKQDTSASFYRELLLKMPRLACMIEDKDKEVLAFLDGIDVFRNQDNAGVRVELAFRPNDFFSNEKLVLESVCGDDGAEIEIIKSEGIKWKPGKNMLVSTVKKAVGNKKGKKKNVEKETRHESIFWVFKEYNAEDFAVDEEEEMADYDMEPTSDRCLFDMACDFADIMGNDFYVYFIAALYDIKTPALEDHCNDDEEEAGGDGKPKNQNCKQQ